MTLRPSWPAGSGGAGSVASWPCRSTRAASLTELDVTVLSVADLTDGRAAVEVDHANLTRGQTELAPVALVPADIVVEPE